MESDNQLDPADQVLAAALKSVAPAAVSIDPVAAAFIAGRSNARKQNRLWQGTALLAVALCCAGWLKPPAQSDRPTTHDTGSNTAVVSATEQSIGPISPLSALSLQRAVLEHGMAGLPPVEVSSNQPVNVQELFN
jgi:hypothetical protein